jgi:hypothetical protein
MPRILRASRDGFVVALVVAVAVIVSLICFAKDPYSYGHMGGEYMQFGADLEPVPMYYWQRWYTGALLVMLCAGTALLFLGWKRRALLTFSLEAACFVAVNIIYVYRDSWATRALIGDEGSALPVEVTILGIVSRAFVIALLLIAHRKSNGGTAQADGTGRL